MSEQAAAAPEGSNSSNSGSKRKHGEDWVRKRVSQACDQCRTKKLKCDGSRPSCATCISLGRECFYGYAVKKRGLPEGYVRALERLLGLLLPDSGSLVSLFERALEDEAAKSNLIRQWNGDGTGSENLPEIWRNSKLCKNLEHLLPALDAGEYKSHDAKRPRLEPHSIDYGCRAGNSQTTVSLQLPVREDAEELLEIYFTYTHSWLPIIGKEDMMATYYRSIELSESSVGLGEHAALWAVLASAESQRSPAPRNSKGEAYLRFSQKSETYCEKARSLITAQSATHDVGHVQALLVLSLIKLATGRFRDAWLLINEAINISIDIGISGTSSHSSAISAARGKHVFLGCFCLDTLISTCLGRRPRIQSDDVGHVGFLEEKGLEEWGHLVLGDGRGGRAGPTRSLSTFNHLIRLLCILNDLGKMGPQQTSFGQIRTAFNKWKLSVPAYCSRKASPKCVLEISSLLPHQLNLDITHSICLEILERRLNLKSDTFSEMVKILRRTADLPHHHSAFGSAAFPPFFYLAVHLSSGITGSPVVTATIERSSLQVDPPRRDCRPSRGEEMAREIMSNDAMDILYSVANAQMPKSVEEGNLVASTSELGFDVHNQHIMSESYEDIETVDGLNLHRTGSMNYSGSRVSASPADWNFRTDSHLSMASRISTSEQRLTQEGLGNNLTWVPNAVSAAGDLFHFAQSSRVSQGNQIGRSDVTGVGNNQNSFSIPDAVPLGIHGVAIDPVLQSLSGADDLFFDLLNLEQLSGDRDETYRNLGFLFPSDTQDQFPLPNYDRQPLGSYPPPVNTADEWSPRFGQPSGSGPSRDNT